MTLSGRGVFVFLTLCFVTSFSSRVIAQTQEVTYTSVLPAYVGDLVDEDHATLQQVNAGPLCARLNAGIALPDSEQQNHANNCIFHIVRFKDPSSTDVQAVDKSNWYIYSNDSRNGFWSLEAFQKNKRLFGSDHFSLFYILINRSSPNDGTGKANVLFAPTKAPPRDQDPPKDDNSCDLPAVEPRAADKYYPSYKIDVVRKVSANIQHLFGLLNAAGLKDTSAVGGGTGSSGTGSVKPKAAAQPADAAALSQKSATASNVEFARQPVRVLALSGNKGGSKVGFLSLDSNFTATACSPVGTGNVGSVSAKPSGNSASGPTCNRAQTLLAAKGTLRADGSVQDAKCQKPDVIFGGGTIDVAYRPSDITISASLLTDDKDLKLSDPYVVDNEGRYYFDFSVPLTLKKLSEVQYQDNTGTFSPVKVDSTNAFMAIDGFYPAVDVKSNNWTRWPHPLTGVAFAKRPLSKILLAGAWGPYFSEVYAGWAWIKQPRVAAGSNSCKASGGMTASASNPFGEHYCGQFSIGLNLTVTGIASKLGSPK